MGAAGPRIDPYLFHCQFHAFKSFVEAKSGVEFRSFKANQYTNAEEGYKDDVYQLARNTLGFDQWRKSAIGNGDILALAIKAIELPTNNLVKWQSRYGDESRPHQALHLAKEDVQTKREIERCLFELYHSSNDSETFAEMLRLFGKKYSLLAYFFFLKDRTTYLPIAPTYFERAFRYLGAEFKVGGNCSWDNYATFRAIIGEIRVLLADALAMEVTLLEAHSFAWMLAAQMEKEGRVVDVDDYQALSDTERDAVVKARIGQGRFRQDLIDYWTNCAVTDCVDKRLLRASHIRPWSTSSLRDRLSHYNGLLLSPTLDACFDCGLISFDDAVGCRCPSAID
jgi:hypothetical protein